MKGNTTLKILEVLKERVYDSQALLELFLTSGRGLSISRIERKWNEKIIDNQIKRVGKNEEKKIKQRFYTMLYKLEKDGLISKNGNNKSISITNKGNEKLTILDKRKRYFLPNMSYPIEKNNMPVIILFDIPETERKKRNWIRIALKNLGFKMMQKSAWIGNIKIPKEFLNDLHTLKLVDYVDVLEIGKTGSLKKVL